MTSSSEVRRQSALLRAGLAGGARPARFATDLRGPVRPGSTRHLSDDDPRLEEARADAWEAGHTAGYQAGLLEAEQERAAWAEATAGIEEQERSERAARFAAVLSTLAAEIDDAVSGATVRDLNETAAHMAVEIAEALVGHHLRVADCAARDAVLRALTDVPRDREVVVRLHPDDVALAAADVDDIAGGRRVTVVADPALEVGSCVVDAGDRSIDARITSALARVREALAR